MKRWATLAVVALSALAGCQKSAPPSDDVVGVGGSPVATTTAAATTAPTAAPIPMPNMPSTGTAGGGATGDPFTQARNANPAAGAGAMGDPFAAARLVPIPQLPASPPPSPGGGTPLKIEPMTFAFAGPITAYNTTAELKPNGLLLLDSKRGGSVGGNKVSITSGKHPVSMSLRSDSYAVYGGYATLKHAFMHRDADGMTSPEGNRLSVSPDGLAIVNTGSAGELLFARISPAITDERGKTTALMIMGAMFGHGIERRETQLSTTGISISFGKAPTTK